MKLYMSPRADMYRQRAADAKNRAAQAKDRSIKSRWNGWRPLGSRLLNKWTGSALVLILIFWRLNLYRSRQALVPSMLDLGIGLGLVLAGFAFGFGAREVVLYRRGQAAKRGHHELG